MQQVVTNILSDAVKYTPDGGTISITVTEHPVREAGKTAVVCVIRDTGIGISKVFLLHTSSISLNGNTTRRPPALKAVVSACW